MTAVMTSCGPTGSSRALPQLSPQAADQQAARQIVDAYGEGVLKSVGNCLAAESETCRKEGAQCKNFMEVAFSIGTNEKINPLRLETNIVQKAAVDSKLNNLNPAQRHVFGLVLNSGATKVAQTKGLGFILWGVERYVRPAQTPEFAKFSPNSSKLLQAYAFAMLTQVKPDHAQVILKGGLRA